MWVFGDVKLYLSRTKQLLFKEQEKIHRYNKNRFEIFRIKLIKLQEKDNKN